MPKYVYHCKECKGNFEIVHGMTETQEDCQLCSTSGFLVRIPQMPFIKTFDSQEKQSSKAGSVVKEAIEDNASILKQQKREASSQVWKKDG
tara:strand:- start:59 stop:331 length:273 start_codon:yes stop_codon:yes gene_type:complete